MISTFKEKRLLIFFYFLWSIWSSVVVAQEIASKDYRSSDWNQYVSPLELKLLGSGTYKTIDALEKSIPQIFMILDEDEAITKRIWESSFADFVKEFPKGVHIVFMSRNVDLLKREKDVSHLQYMIEMQKENESVSNRVFYSVDHPTVFRKWFKDSQNTTLNYFALNENHYLWHFGRGFSYQLPKADWSLKLVYEAQYLLYLKSYKEKMHTLKEKSKEWVLFKNITLKGEWNGGGITKEVQVPEDIKKFNKLYVQLELSCEKVNCHNDQGEGFRYYDFLVQLYMCDGKLEDEQAKKCEDWELARWVTGYASSSKWVHDISPMLALMQKQGSPKTIRLWTPEEYQVSLSFFFSRKVTDEGGLVARPQKILKLFQGGSFDVEYAKWRKEKIIQVPLRSVPQKVELISTISGHGWGKSKENCAEFCDSEHEFRINDKWTHQWKLETRHMTDCTNSIQRGGGASNQLGNWFYGRGGWCPGVPVFMKRKDVPQDILEGDHLDISYRGLYQGAPFKPTSLNLPHPRGFDANILMNSYLVFY